MTKHSRVLQDCSPNGGHYIPQDPSYDSGYRDGKKAGQEYMKSELEQFRHGQDQYQQMFYEEKRKLAALEAKCAELESAFDANVADHQRMCKDFDRLIEERDALRNSIEGVKDLVSKALSLAWQLGQTYWQQADSEYASQYKKADETCRRFDALTLATRDSIEVAMKGEGK